MELARRTIQLPTESTTVRIFPFGDIHLGAAACDLRAATRTRDLIAADPNSYWLGMGDLADAIMPSDPRWAFRVLDWKQLGKRRDGTPDVDDLANATVEYVDEFFGPIWDRCLGLLEGNHEQSLKKWYYTDLIRRLCHRHEVPYLGQTALIRLDLQGNKWSVPLTIFAEHGANGGGTDGNSLNSLLKRMEQFDADIYYKGHVHKKGITKKSSIGWGPAVPSYHERIVQLTGTYLQGYEVGDTTYAEKKGLPPTEIGGTVTLLRVYRNGDQSEKNPALRQRLTHIDAVYTEALGLLAA